MRFGVGFYRGGDIWARFKFQITWKGNFWEQTYGLYVIVGEINSKYSVGVAFMSSEDKAKKYFGSRYWSTIKIITEL